ncbi:MAG TPA: ABC transporter substrate-binding protein [Stellaceae bacterium]|jgi:branched-chain amino acid transport system substrate-binding protein|nr:ABC transporter substrate-binding protein [Stellaceae bacterium]
MAFGGRLLRCDLIVSLALAVGALAMAPALAETPSGKPIRIGQTLSLTGPFAQTGLAHQIASQIFVDRLNQSGGLLGRPVEYVVLDDQSKPDVSRTLYEKLITADNVDLIQGPYGTAAILAAMSVAARYHKVFIENTLGQPALATYPWHFSATIGGSDSTATLPVKVLDAYASTGHPPKNVLIVSSKFPSAEDMAHGMEKAAKARGIEQIGFLEYDVGNRDFSGVAARVKDANPDFLFVSCLGVEGDQLLEAEKRIDYVPQRHFYLYPSGTMAADPLAEHATSYSGFEDVAPYTSTEEGGAFAKEFDAWAQKAGLPYPHVDSQAGNEYAGWQILIAAIKATNSLDDKTIAEWLDKNAVETIEGKRDFSGRSHTSAADMQQLKQVQGGKWVAIWPLDVRTPGVQLIAP